MKKLSLFAGILAVPLLVSLSLSGTGRAESVSSPEEITEITHLKSLQTEHGLHALAGTGLDSQRNRLGVDFTCLPEPKLTFHLGFYPEKIPVSLTINGQRRTQPVLGNANSGFFSPRFTGRKATALATEILQPGATAGNSAGSGFRFPESLRGKILQIREDLPCME